jgi:hypothetical protein
LVIKRFQKSAAVGLFAQPVQANGVKPLEDIPVFTVQGCAAVLFSEPLNILKARDDAFFPSRPAAHGFGFGLNA